MVLTQGSQLAAIIDILIMYVRGGHTFQIAAAFNSGETSYTVVKVAVREARVVLGFYNFNC